MPALHHDAARAAGLATLELALKYETPGLAGTEGFRGQGRDDDRNSATAEKAIRTAIAKAALLGIEARQLSDSTWLLRHAGGADIGRVRGVGALAAAVAGFEAACSDVRELMQRMRRTA